jgi:hypothetical protein
MRKKLILLSVVLLLGGCQTAPRRAAPPDVIGHAIPEGFPADVRLVTTDLSNFTALALFFFAASVLQRLTASSTSSRCPVVAQGAPTVRGC